MFKICGLRYLELSCLLFLSASRLLTALELEPSRVPASASTIIPEDNSLKQAIIASKPSIIYEDEVAMSTLSFPVHEHQSMLFAESYLEPQATQWPSPVMRTFEIPGFLRNSTASLTVQKNKIGKYRYDIELPQQRWQLHLSLERGQDLFQKLILQNNLLCNEFGDELIIQVPRINHASKRRWSWFRSWFSESPNYGTIYQQSTVIIGENLEFSQSSYWQHLSIAQRHCRHEARLLLLAQELLPEASCIIIALGPEMAKFFNERHMTLLSLWAEQFSVRLACIVPPPLAHPDYQAQRYNYRQRLRKLAMDFNWVLIDPFRTYNVNELYSENPIKRDVYPVLYSLPASRWHREIAERIEKRFGFK